VGRGGGGGGGGVQGGGGGGGGGGVGGGGEGWGEWGGRGGGGGGLGARSGGKGGGGFGGGGGGCLGGGGGGEMVVPGGGADGVLCNFIYRGAFLFVFVRTFLPPSPPLHLALLYLPRALFCKKLHLSPPLSSAPYILLTSPSALSLLLRSLFPSLPILIRHVRDSCLQGFYLLFARYALGTDKGIPFSKENISPRAGGGEDRGHEFVDVTSDRAGDSLNQGSFRRERRKRFASHPSGSC